MTFNGEYDGKSNLVRNKITEILNPKLKDPASRQEVYETNLKILNDLEEASPRDIKIVRDLIPNINCYAFSLGLHRSRSYTSFLIDIKYGESEKQGVRSCFISYLLENEYLREKAFGKDCLILYFDKDDPKHAGIVEQESSQGFKEIICGRWGNHRAVISHRLWHVGWDYGSKVKCYRPLSTKESERYFIKYLQYLSKKGEVFAQKRRIIKMLDEL